MKHSWSLVVLWCSVVEFCLFAFIALKFIFSVVELYARKKPKSCCDCSQTHEAKTCTDRQER